MASLDSTTIAGVESTSNQDPTEQALHLDSRRKKRVLRRLSTTMIRTYGASIAAAGDGLSPSADHTVTIQTPARDTEPVKRQRSSPASYLASIVALNGDSSQSHEELPDKKQYDAIMKRFQIRLRQTSFRKSNRDLASSRSSRILSINSTGHSKHSFSRRDSREGSMSPQTLSSTGLGHGNYESENPSNATNELKDNGEEAVHAANDDPASLAQELRQELRFQLEYVLSPMAPYSSVSRVRSAVLVLTCVAYAVVLPVEIAFSMTTPAWLDSVGDAVDLVLLLDFVLMFNTAFVEKHGAVVTSRHEIIAHYLKGWFLPDLISSIPVHWLKLARGKTHRWLFFLSDIAVRSNRVTHLLHIFRLVWFAYVGHSGKSLLAWFQYSRYSYLVRIAWILGLVLLLAHYIACFWEMLQVPTDNAPVPFIEDYAANLYVALQLLQGQGLPTVTVGQNLFASFAVLAGSVVLAIVFGHVAVLVSNFNANTTDYQRKMESVFAIMDKMQLPAPLRERIHQYYEHLWREYDSLDGEIVKFSKDLTHNLALEVVLFKYMVLVMHVPFWQECSADFQKQIVLRLQVRVYLPDDFIIRREEVGDEFYMINRGCCELERDADSCEHGTPPLRHEEASESGGVELYAKACYSQNSQRGQDQSNDSEGSGKKRMNVGPDLRSASSNLVQLSRGQAFGEIALLMNYNRTVSVRAVSHVEMCVITRKEFQEVLKRYPVDRRHVVMQILTTFMDQNEASRGFCPLKDVVRSVMYAGDTSAPLSTMHAALLVSEVMDPALHDETAHFGIDAKLAQQLAALKPQGHSTTAAFAAKSELPPALETRLLQIEENQAHTLRVLEHVLQAIEALKQEPAPSTSLRNKSFNGSSEPQRPLRLLRPKPADVEDHAETGSLRTEPPQHVPVHLRRSSFVRKRSISTPIIHAIPEQSALAINDAQPVRSERILERVMSATHLVSSASRGLAKPSQGGKGGGGKPIAARRNSVSKYVLPELKQWKPFFERLIRFSSSAESATQSPTQLADQLFQPRAAPGDRT